MPDDICNILIVSPKSIHPSHHKVVTVTELVEEPFSFRSILEHVLHPRNTMVGDDFIDQESGFSGLADLVVEGLFDGRDSGIEECGYGNLLLSLRVMSVDYHVR